MAAAIVARALQWAATFTLDSPWLHEGRHRHARARTLGPAQDDATRCCTHRAVLHSACPQVPSPGDCHCAAEALRPLHPKSSKPGGSGAVQSSAEQSGAVQCSAAQCRAEQCSAAQSYASQCRAEQCSAEQGRGAQCTVVTCSAVQCRAVQWSAVQSSAVQFSAEQRSVATS